MTSRAHVRAKKIASFALLASLRLNFGFGAFGAWFRAHHQALGTSEDARDLQRDAHLELVVAAVARGLVRPPALEVRRVAEAIALHVIVRDLGDELDAERLPREILAAVPAARRARLPLLPGRV